MIALILAAAGSGRRFGAEVPKQFAIHGDLPLYLHSIYKFQPFVSETVVVVAPDRVESVRQELDQRFGPERLRVVIGGASRRDSVYNGINFLSDSIQYVLVHDAARPFLSTELIQRVIEGTRIRDACVPVLPISDTLKEVGEGMIRGTVDRDRYVLAQTPQGFEIGLLRRAFEQSRRDGFLGSDEAVLVERLGVPVYVVAGEGANYKVTWREDLR